MTLVAQEKQRRKAQRSVAAFARKHSDIPADYFETYFAQSPVDGQDYDTETHLQWALQHYQQAQRKGTTIEIFHPDREQHGWEDHRTVVRIVTRNRPFIVDSVRMALSRLGYQIYLFIHPIFSVQRDKQGITAISGDKDGSTREAFLHILIDRIADPAACKTLQKALKKVLTDVKRVTDDWPAMQKSLQQVMQDLQAEVTGIDETERCQAYDFLQWLGNDHFTFLGYRNYELEGQSGQEKLTAEHAGLGLLRSLEQESRSFSALPAELRQRIREPNLLLVTKTVSRSIIHRSAHMDYIAIRRFDQQGQVIGEHRFIGLFTSRAYRQPAFDIPIIRDKLQAVLDSAQFDPISHTGKAFKHILETFPRDELFQISQDDLTDIAMGILYLEDRQQIRLFVRPDTYRRFVTCFIYVPRDAYDSDLRQKMTRILLNAFNSEDLDFNVRLTDDPLARVEFYIRTQPDQFPDYDVVALEQKLADAAYAWDDKYRQAVQSQQGQPIQRYLDYLSRIPVAYKADFDPSAAVQDIDVVMSLSAQQPFQVDFYQLTEKTDDQAAAQLRLKLYQWGQPIAPSDSLPVLENLGVRVVEEKPYCIRCEAGQPIYIHNHLLEVHGDYVVHDVKQHIEQTIRQVWANTIENDGFNQLILHAGLSTREALVFRAYAKYLQQVQLPYSQPRLVETLVKHASITTQLKTLFVDRFSDTPTDDLISDIEAALDAITSLDEDRILRYFFSVIQATVRTNYFIGGDQPRDYLSFKLDSTAVPDLPKPVPLYEIFVYAIEVEGIHLRGGKVSRGGLRWSDRPDDFRTEVLGLMKAQMVKNAIIVPTGAKGGFVVKAHPQNGQNMKDLVADCYSTFIRGLLDITDNLVNNQVVHPTDVVRHDGDDPYLVVAADKGTATFSDLANRIAREYDFWLDDAFASGGSAGYDHKKMAITARGAWESVKLLFRDLGKNIQKENFTVVGIGDMGGDVFGNGMLLSKHIRLIAAFNHKHIFLDPDPDAARSFKERKRLFKKTPSSWEDYNPELISAGGGVFSRADKSINLSAEAQQALGTTAKRLSPTDLINTILKAPVDLLWNGGIGTYVKASFEDQAAADDRANDNLRVNGNQLRCLVVGEGGNLGLTQPGRIEYALNGGRLDTDFIHNAGGVHSSDIEVNIKILLNAAVRDQRLNLDQRNDLLASMTDDVAAAVLDSNYWQEIAISQVEYQAVSLLDTHRELINTYEHQGHLDRQVEHLPTDKVLQERRAIGQGLTRPEIAVVVSYTKMALYDAMQDDDLWNDPYYQCELQRYFPQALREQYSDLIGQHRLDNEIIATFIINRMVNRLGATFVHRMQEQQAATAEIVRAYTIVWEVFNLRHAWQLISDLDYQVPAEIQKAMLAVLTGLIERASLWVVQHVKPRQSVADAIAQFQPGANQFQQTLLDQYCQPEQRWLDAGVPESLARMVSCADALYSSFDVVNIAAQRNVSVDIAAALYQQVSQTLQLNWLIDQTELLPENNVWEQQSRSHLMSSLYEIAAQVTQKAVKFWQSYAKKQRLDETDASQLNQTEWTTAWRQQQAAFIDWYEPELTELQQAESVDIAMILVVIQQLQTRL